MNPFLALLAVLIGFGFTWWYTVTPVTRESLASPWEDDSYTRGESADEHDTRVVAQPSRRTGGARTGVAAGATASRVSLAERFEQARASLTSRVEGLRERSHTIDEDDDRLDDDLDRDAAPARPAARERYDAASDDLILSEDELAQLDDEQTTAIDDEFTVGTPVAESTAALQRPRSSHAEQVRIIEADAPSARPARDEADASVSDDAPRVLDADIDGDPYDADGDRESLVAEPHAGVPTQVVPVEIPTRPAQVDVDPGDPSPTGYTVKGDVKARLYLVPGDADFERARPTTWFVDERAALDAGYAHYVPRPR